jgi:hypothetical protein
MTKLAIAFILAAAAAGSAFADDITIEATPFESTAARADVVAGLHAFKAAGVDPWAIDYNPLAALVSSEDRAQVSAEYVAGRVVVAAFTGEDSGSSYLAQNGQASEAVRVAGQPATAW